MLKLLSKAFNVRNIVSLMPANKFDWVVSANFIPANFKLHTLSITGFPLGKYIKGPSTSGDWPLAKRCSTSLNIIRVLIIL